MTFDIAARTHVGLKRSENQDEVLAETIVEGDRSWAILAVADGMGGHAHGREASQRAIETVKSGLRNRLSQPGSAPTEAWCSELAEEAHRSVEEISRADETSGTTLTMAVIEGGDCFIGNVGDSRAYRYRDGRLEQLTADHTWEAYAAKHGIENPHGKALRQAVGVAGEFEPETHRIELRPNDWLLLCSDGLYKMAEIEKVEAELAKSRVADDACVRLIKLALNGGGRDNVSVCIARFGPPTEARARTAIVYVVIAALLAIAVLIVLAVRHKIG